MKASSKNIGTFQLKLREKLETDFAARVVILLIGLLTTLVTYVAVKDYSELKESELFQSKSVHRSLAIERGIQEHLESVNALSAMIPVRSNISYREFSRFATPYLRKYSGLKSMLWIPLINHANRKTFETDMQKYYPDFIISVIDVQGEKRLAPEREDYLPIVYVFPLAYNDNLVGYNMLDNIEFYKASRLALQTRKQFIINALQRETSLAEQEKLILKPVYNQNYELLGFAGGVISLSRIVEYSLDIFQSGNFTIHISSEDNNRTRFSYSDNIQNMSDLVNMPIHPEPVSKDLVNIRNIAVANERWRLAIEPAPGYSVIDKIYLFGIPLIAVVAVTALIMSYIVLLQRREEFFQKAAMIDGLTGAYNREYFDAAFATEWRLAVRRNTSLGIILVDIDNFRHFNMEVGHVEADNCLIDITNAVRLTIKRAGDFVARYETDRIVVVLPVTPLDGIKRIAEKVKASVDNLSIPNHSAPLGVITVSIGGVVLSPSDSDSLDIVLDQLEETLLKVKNFGKNAILIEELGNE